MKRSNGFFSIVAYALAAGLLTALDQTQNTPSRPVQNASLIRATATKAENETPVANAAIRPFHLNATNEALSDPHGKAHTPNGRNNRASRTSAIHAREYVFSTYIP